jgi:hypothetical protein
MMKKYTLKMKRKSKKNNRGNSNTKKGGKNPNINQTRTLFFGAEEKEDDTGDHNFVIQTENKYNKFKKEYQSCDCKPDSENPYGDACVEDEEACGNELNLNCDCEIKKGKENRVHAIWDPDYDDPDYYDDDESPPQSLEDYGFEPTFGRELTIDGQHPEMYDDYDNDNMSRGWTGGSTPAEVGEKKTSKSKSKPDIKSKKKTKTKSKTNTKSKTKTKTETKSKTKTKTETKSKKKSKTIKKTKKSESK